MSIYNNSCDTKNGLDKVIVGGGANGEWRPPAFYHEWSTEQLNPLGWVETPIDMPVNADKVAVCELKLTIDDAQKDVYLMEVAVAEANLPLSKNCEEAHYNNVYAKKQFYIRVK